MKKAIAYYRVSTDKQGIRGLGMESQRDNVLRYAAAAGYEIVGAFEEVKSGAKRNRRQVLAALEACRREGATLLVATLDRLARDVGFVDKVIKGDVPFICVDMPDANKMMLQMFAIFAEYERDKCSRRTRNAAVILRARGVQLGNMQEKQRGRERALEMRGKIDDARALGIESARGLAGVCGVAVSTMTRVLRRLREIDEEKAGG